MDKILVEPILSRNWKVSKERWELVYGEREKERKKSDSRVNERIYYMWFNYLQLSLDLERIGYEVPKRGGRGKIISTTNVKVSRTTYQDWNLEGLKDLRFREWYEEDKHRSLFTEGGFRFTRGTQYHPLVKRFNVFILFHNMMNDKNLYLKGDRSKGTMVSEKIVEELQKKRYDLLDRKDFGKIEDTSKKKEKIIVNQRKLSSQKRVMKDVVDCEKTILAVCEGRFPK